MTHPPRGPLPGPAGLRQAVPAQVSFTSDSLVSHAPLAQPGEPPLVVRPTAAGVDVAAWAAHARPWLDETLADHGAVLLRGFSVTTTHDLEPLAAALVDELYRDNGEHPRASLSGSISSPVFFPPEEKLLWHTENSFNDTGPARIMFCCARPAASGGETPIVDSRQVFRRLDADLRSEFLAKGVMYVRHYGTGLGLDWREVLRTGDRSEAEARCAQQGLRSAWDGDRLRTEAVRPAAVRHPRTGVWSWINQAQHWHPACLAPATRAALEATHTPDALPRQCHFGDGSPIPDEAMAEICRVYAELEVCFAWERGDVLVLDNILVAHARNPFSGPRELLVAMGDMVRFA
ncbi:TauD/TfdA family dioxygenase [Streptomyces sp. NPDC050844]|uniref:TauD/TfdA family dioxygenase n=1 Tax=Streptomyces sp. NPDC050844 TaxID=3155790 RepID=UPI00340615E8